ncbi:MlaD family protein [Ferruginibacter paludis]|uniref:MlaD family protein n=1 Tax=Ferruginibacter paludis TaxID=1310417 RepID=UPI0025B3D953|nr:MlaD family protein [Ferruginibacter paludis]MDN3655512.1 MlaD family protein [Ferruginibacter paludis]
MPRKKINTIKLGAFVLTGLLALVLLLYMIGKNQNLFGSTYVLKARFENIQGLVAGNNVRYAGIQTGTVKVINIVDDTTIEIVMLIEKRMLKIIRKNAVVSIGTDGFVGNKVVNISPARQRSDIAQEGDILLSKKSVATDDMLQLLSKTNTDISVIAAELKTTVQRINQSDALWSLLNDKSIPQNIRLAVANIRSATDKANNTVASFQAVASDIQQGKGSVGTLLKDTVFAANLNEAILKIKSVGGQADSLLYEISTMVAGIKEDKDNGNGTLHALFKDSGIVIKLNASLDNIQRGTDGFNQNMEALKHNFLFRGFFKKQAKQQEKENKLKNTASQ